MEPTLSAEQLVEAIRPYYRADRDYEMQEDASPEDHRLNHFWHEVHERDGARWDVVIDAIEREHPEYRLGHITNSDPCFKVSVYDEMFESAGREVEFVTVGCMSMIAPVYTVYCVRWLSIKGVHIFSEALYEPLPPRVRRPTEVIARAIEAEFKVTRLPRELAETFIPFNVRDRDVGETNLFHALFTPDPARCVF